MTDAALASRLQAEIGAAGYLAAGHRALLDFRDAGGTRERALRVLSVLRASHSADDVLESRVLEWMDFAWGWSRRRVW